jgi:hypothetical protein
MRCSHVNRSILPVKQLSRASGRLIRVRSGGDIGSRTSRKTIFSREAEPRYTQTKPHRGPMCVHGGISLQ